MATACLREENFPLLNSRVLAAIFSFSISSQRLLTILVLPFLFSLDPPPHTEQLDAFLGEDFEEDLGDALEEDLGDDLGDDLGEDLEGLLFVYVLLETDNLDADPLEVFFLEDEDLEGDFFIYDLLGEDLFILYMNKKYYKNILFKMISDRKIYIKKNG